MRRSTTCLTALLVSLASACGGGDDDEARDPNAIRIGAMADSTGTSATILYSASLDLAGKQMNEGLARAGTDIRFDVQIRDSQSNPDIAVPSAVELINEQGVKGLVTDNSGSTVAVNMLNYAGDSDADYPVPVACYLCSSAFINNPEATNADEVRQNAERDPDNWLFRTFFINRFESIVQTQIAAARSNGGDINGDGRFKVGVYAIDDSYGQSSAEAVKEAVAAIYEGESSVEIKYVDRQADANSYDWGGDLAVLMDDYNEDTAETDGEPDAVFLALLPLGSTAAAKAYREGDWDAPIQATTAFRRNYIVRALGAAADGVEGNSPPLYAKDESGEAFVQAFTNAAGEGPEMGCAGAYDGAVSLMLASLQAAVGLDDPSEVDPADVRREMENINEPDGEIIRPTVADFAKAFELIQAGMPINYEGASSANNYDSVGDVYPELVHWQVESGEFRELEAYDCSTDPLCPAAE